MEKQTMRDYGYGGRVLRINLNDKSFKIEPIDISWMKKVIGGRPANSMRLYEEIDPNCDPLGPDNILIFGIGPLTGTLLPASAYFTVSAKSPLTGILGDSAAGGQFASEMKQTGFDQIIITGKSDQFIYLKITDEGVEFKDANGYRGKDIISTTRLIREENRDYAIQVAAIGKAGENQVLFSSIVSSGNRVNGRTGMGAVMGSKNIKALAIRGKRPVKIADPITFMNEAKIIQENIVANEEYQKRYDLGTTMLMNDLNSIGILPTKHFKEGVCDYVDHISGERLANIFKVKNKACFNCNVHCSRYYVSKNAQAEGPEFETLCGFSSRIGSSDLDFALEMNEFVNQMGMDSLSSCEVIGWLMECQEMGLIKSEDIDGIELKWGDTGAVRNLMKMIVNREGIGDKLAEGATKFSKNFGKEAQKLVMQVKGLDIICGDPRGIKAYGLTYAVASRGADHLRAEPYFELTQKYKIAKKRFGTEKAADRLAEEGKAALVTYSEKIALLTDSLTMCKNVGLCMDVLNFKNAASLLIAATGMKFTAKGIEKIMANAVDLDFKLNKKFGLKQGNDILPERFTKEPLKEGPTKGSVVDIKRMVDEYYKLHNWVSDNE